MTDGSARQRNDEALVTIAVFDTEFEASVARGALEAIGIPAYAPGEALGSFSRGLGGVSPNELQVFESDRDRAVAELQRMQMRLADAGEDVE